LDDGLFGVLDYASLVDSLSFLRACQWSELFSLASESLKKAVCDALEVLISMLLARFFEVPGTVAIRGF
jgi:hypothetical protein